MAAETVDRDNTLTISYFEDTQAFLARTGPYSISGTR